MQIDNLRSQPKHTNERGLEESLGAAETLVSNGDDLAVGQLIGLLQRGGRGSSSHFILEVQSNVTQLLLNITHNLTLSYGREERAYFILGKDNENIYIAFMKKKCQKLPPLEARGEFANI